MKKMNKLTVAALALAAIGFASTAASAQVTPGATDLVLGFQLAGNNTDLEVDLGPASQFTQGAYVNLSSDLTLGELTSTFGSSWASTSLNTGVNWSVAGITSTTDGASFDATSTAGANNVRTSSGSGLGTPWGLVSSLAGGSAGSGSLNGSPSAATSQSALIGGSVTSTNPSGSPAGSLSESYQVLLGGNPGYTFVNNPEQTGVGTDELYSFTPQNKVSGKYPLATDLGTFTLSDTGGNLQFYFGTPQAVPEPSAYALALCALLLFVVLKRRHSVA
jgi:hypothetical protein